MEEKPNQLTVTDRFTQLMKDLNKDKRIVIPVIKISFEKIKSIFGGKK